MCLRSYISYHLAVYILSLITFDYGSFKYLITHILSKCYLQIGHRGDHGGHVQHHVVVTNLVLEPAGHVDTHQQVVLGHRVKHKVVAMENVQVKLHLKYIHVYFNLKVV